MSSISDGSGTRYLSNLTFNPAGLLTSAKLGNGVTETFGYDNQTLQVTSEAVTVQGGASGGLLNLNYSYQAAAGQLGLGTTAGNAGQIVSVSNSTINGSAETASYGYDLLRRLTTSAQTSSGASAQRRFAYDRWGNRTGMWDSVSGGNQLQSITLQQAGGAPTNQIQNVTTTGMAAFSYDAAGNLTSDGVHTYQYDGENRLRTVDGGATAAYAYDYNNCRFSRTAGGAATHYIWDDGQVLAEHNAATGAVLVDYIPTGNTPLAKIASGVTNYFVSDRLSVRLTLDASGNVSGQQAHLPFGEGFAESGQQEKHHFTAYEEDAETGADYAVNRFHTASTGRFMSADPYQQSGHLADPQSWNRYSYTQGDPLNKLDPLGLDPQVCFAVPVQGVEGGAVVCIYDDDPGRRAQPEQTADTGGGGDSLRTRLDRVLANGQCGKKLGGLHLGGTNGAPDDVASFLRSAAMTSELTDLTSRQDLTNVTARDLDWSRWGGPYDVALSAWFGGSDPNTTTVGPDGRTVFAHTQVTTHEIFVGHNYDISGDAVKDVTITHELLHVLFPDAGHADIANELGVPGGPYANDAAASDSLDRWLRKGCPDALPGKGADD
jgi:RHS repeat-associated protein